MVPRELGKMCFQMMRESRAPQRAGRHDVFLILEAVELRSYARSRADPARQHKGKQQAGHRAHLGGQVNLEQCGHDDEGHAGQNIGDTLHDQVGQAAVVALDRAVNRADDEVDEGYTDSHQQAQLDAAGHAQLQIVALAVGA